MERPMTRAQSRSSFLLVILGFVAVLSGCATLPQNLGIRPNEPAIAPKADLCDQYVTYATYAQGLQEAYHSRSSQNRGWIYVAGLVGLGVAAASGGLAAATTVAAGTLALLAISGGFAAASFATINNSDLALSYTVAANKVDTALMESRAKLVASTTSAGYTNDSCAAALSTLSAGVSEARTHLEVARTNNAAGALARAKDQRDLLNKSIGDLEAPPPPPAPAPSK